MNKNKHTPGPWIEVYNECADETSVQDAQGTKVAIPFGHNARLIAAAPELLEALEFASRWLKDRHGQDFKRIDDAIRKAKGET